MINRIKSRINRLRLRWQLFLVLLAAGIASLYLFRVLWHARKEVYFLLSSASFLNLPVPSETLWTDLAEAAARYELPDSENDIERIEKIQPFLELTDSYTSIYIYGGMDGLYRAGKYADNMDVPNFRFFFDLGYQVTEGAGEEYWNIPMKFKNGYANVMIYFYHSSVFIHPYFYFCTVFCILLFLSAVLYFIGRKMKHVLILEREILRMSSGDLEHPVPACGLDEIGTLGRELDRLRLTLSENIRQEQESRQANQDLITAMSHDLRTPLTVLRGYLEIMKLKRNPDMREDYLSRCLDKTDEIRELTDRMFEYALVYEETEYTDVTSLPVSLLVQCLTENADYIRLTGFQVSTDLSAVCSFVSILGDEAMLRRTCNNLFSNILKYGDKKSTVQIFGTAQNGSLRITLSNGVKKEYTAAQSNRIGLKSVKKMMERMKGSFEIQTDENYFEAILSFCTGTK